MIFILGEKYVCEDTDYLERALTMEKEGYTIKEIVYEILALRLTDRGIEPNLDNEFDSELLEHATIMSSLGISIVIIVEDLLATRYGEKLKIN